MAFNKSTSLLLFTVIVLVSTSCNLFKRTPVISPDSQTEAAPLKGGEDEAKSIYRASVTKYWELIHTAIDIRFNLPERTATATADLTLHPYFYATDSVVLDAKSMHIQDVLDGNHQPLSFKYDSLKLFIQLPHKYSNTDTIKLTIHYKALPYLRSAGGSDAIREDRGLYFINADQKEPFMPVQIWTQGETEGNSHWFPTFDNPIFKSTFSITIHVPDSFKTLSNGALVKSVKENVNFRADTWNQTLPISTYLAMMAIGDYAISKETWRGKEVSYYVPQDYAAFGKSIFANTPEMMTFFSDKLGVPYPWNKYSQIVGYEYVSGAMENVSASLFGAFNLKDNRQLADDNNDFIVAHELFHQWFGDYVTAESWSNLTLNESFADYSEHLWTEYKYGEDARANYWMLGLGKYLKQAKYNDPPLLRYYYDSQEEMFDRISYSKGGLILHYLRSLTGDKAFFEALHLYLTQNAFQNAEVAQLRIAFEKVTGKDWNWFFNQWYTKGGHPKLAVDYYYDDLKASLKVVVSQHQTDSVGLYELPMQTLIICGNGTKDVRWTVSGQKDTFEIAYVNGMRPVVVPDALHWIPGEWVDNKTPWQWFTQYQQSENYLCKRDALTGLAVNRKSDTCKMVYEQALKDKNPLLRAYAIGLYDYEKKQVIDETWKIALGKLAANDPDNKVRAKAIKALGDLKEETYITQYEIAIADSSYKVAAAGLYALNKVNHKRAFEYAKELHPEKMRGNVLLYQAAEVIAQDGDAQDWDFFKDRTMHLFENERKLFLGALQNYLVNAKEVARYKQGVDFLKSYALQNVENFDGYYCGAIILNLKKYALSQAKVATDKEQITKWKERSEIAQLAWQEYKSSVKEEGIISAINQFEKAE